MNQIGQCCWKMFRNDQNNSRIVRDAVDSLGFRSSFVFNLKGTNMTKQHLDTGEWFDEDTARIWNENTDWDGSNHVSSVTGSPWEHARLYRTVHGTWVLGQWSQVGEGAETFRTIDPDSAARWLIRCDRELPFDLLEIESALEV